MRLNAVNRRLRAAMLLTVTILAGCLGKQDQSEIVVYTALDRQFSEPIFDSFTRATDIRVRAKYDVEANKTVGLTNLIINEQRHPRCDLFWNNEILNTLRLQKPRSPPGLLGVRRRPFSAIHTLDHPSLVWICSPS